MINSFVKWLTKRTKISKIIEYVYTGLLSASSALEVFITNFSEKEKLGKLAKVLEIIKIGSNALEKILDWIGGKDSISNARRNAENFEISEFKRGISNEL